MRLRTLLLISLFLRLILVFLGGQHFFPDEGRYDWVLQACNLNWAGSVLAHPGHPGFFVVMLPVAMVHLAAAAVLGKPQEELNWIPAVFNAVASTSVIGLTYGIALRSTKQTNVSMLAAFGVACSTSMLYFSRHLIPYDSSAALTLLGLFLALGPEVSWLIAMGAGLILGLSLLDYTGNVMFVFVALCVGGWHLRRSYKSALAFIFATGFPVLCLRVFAGREYWNVLQAFSRLVNQGSFGEGAAVPWVYLWLTEHFLFVILLIGLVFSFKTSTRDFAWATVALYAAMAFASVGLGRFVVYGRTARTLVPFLCIAAAGGFEFLLNKLPTIRPIWRGLVPAVAAVILIQVAVNFAPIFTQRYPGDVAKELARFLPYGQAFSVGACAAAPAVPLQPRLILWNASYLWPAECVAGQPRGREIYRTRHPFEYAPYAFESFAPHQRSLFERTDISIRLVQQY